MITTICATIVLSLTSFQPITFSTYYGSKWHGKKMANGQVYDQNKFSVACNAVPLNSWITVKYKDRLVRVKVTDRMHRRFTGKRIDLSFALWKHMTNGAKPGLAKGVWSK